MLFTVSPYECSVHCMGRLVQLSMHKLLTGRVFPSVQTHCVVCGIFYTPIYFPQVIIVWQCDRILHVCMVQLNVCTYL